jgi:hypothetical protein
VIRNGDQYFLGHTVTVDGKPDPKHTIISENDLSTIIEAYKAECIHNDLTMEELFNKSLTKSWIASLSVNFDACDHPLEIESDSID